MYRDSSTYYRPKCLKSRELDKPEEFAGHLHLNPSALRTSSGDWLSADARAAKSLQGIRRYRHDRVRVGPHGEACIFRGNSCCAACQAHSDNRNRQLTICFRDKLLNLIDSEFGPP